MKRVNDKALMQEMGANEMKEVNGGLPIPAIITVAGACIYIYNNWDDFCEGVKSGWESAK